MKLLTGLFRATRKRMMTTDNDMGMFRDKLMELVSQKDSLSDEEVTTRVEELKAMTNDLPDDEGKAKLARFLEDFKEVKSQDAKVAEEAAKSVADQFEKLDTAAMQDVPGEVETTVAEETTTEETPLVEGQAPEEPDTTVAEEAVEETTAEDGLDAESLENQKEEPEPEPTEDDDPNPEYTLEEIYQFIKKRMAEDAEGEEKTVEEVEEESVESEDGLGDLNRLINSTEEGPAGYSAEGNETKDECKKDDEVVTDCAPRIPVTVKNDVAGGSLASLFELAKRG